MTAEKRSLPAALHFTASDLRANRQGLLSQAQMERMKIIRGRNTRSATALFFGLVLGATILLFIGQLNRSAILLGAGAALIVINAIMVGRAARAYMRVGGDLRRGSVEVLAGEVERVLRRGRASESYLLRISGAELGVTKDVFVGFRHKASYRIYRARNSLVLLSAEPMS